MVLLLTLVGCGDRFRDCSEVPPAHASLPERLSETGLYGEDGALAPGVLPFTPNFPLWSDGADKERWVRIPAGATIDTSDPDDWIFPDGTTFWKAFRRDGELVETRMIQRTGDEWSAVAYVWDGDDARATPDGAEDANGTPHDVPTSQECTACHGGRESFVLGFSAVQLAGASPLGLEDLVGQLEEVPEVTFAGTDEDRQALGYLHANCSHCHNAPRMDGGVGCFDPYRRDFTLPSRVGSLRRDTVVGADGAIVAGRPENSQVIRRMSKRNERGQLWASMPPLGTEEEDAHAVEMLEAWIRGLR